ncbi:MAG: phage holin family protein [Oscillospiraceae bacterium]|nr:phage holin family protein [Oscillospiraceae bacterium]
MRETICTVLGAVGGILAAVFGGWNAMLTTLILFMSMDYVTGLMVSGIFRRSPKTETGGLQSKVGWKGLVKKVVILLLVVAAARIDLILDTTYIRNAVCIGFACNELISILENAGLMGIPLPAALKNAVDLLQKKSNSEQSAKEKEHTDDDNTDLPKQ